VPKPSLLTHLQTEIANQSAANDSGLQIGLQRRPRRAPVELTVRVLEAMRPGETLWDASVGGFYAVRGVRSVILKLAIDVTHGKTVRRTVGKWRPGDSLRELRRQAEQLRAQVRANPEAFTNQGRAGHQLQPRQRCSPSAKLWSAT